MAIRMKSELGYVEYADDILASLAGSATMECYGVVGMASKRTADGLWELLKRENLSKGIKISSKGEEVIVDVFIIVEYGTKISVIANNIIQKVKYTLEGFTGLKVSNVTVYVQGIRV